jgi:2-polyprenyl-3-methyl-5-hydroxy-6-metoxy-1,4-benzoquinol methylase
MSKTAFDARRYWESRLSERFDLTGVGTCGFSTHYNRWLYKAKLRALRKAFAQFNIRCENKRVLDVGCGTGFFVDTYLALGARSITGIDITRKSIQALQQRYPQHTFVQADIGQETLGIMGQFDIINAFDVLYHIRDDTAFENALVNLARLAVPGAFVFVTDLFGPTNIKDVEHVALRDMDAYATVLAQNGIEVLSLIPLYCLMNRPFPGWAAKMGRAGAGIVVRLDNLLAPVLFFLDRFLLAQHRPNLSLLVGRKQ